VRDNYVSLTQCSPYGKIASNISISCSASINRPSSTPSGLQRCSPRYTFIGYRSRHPMNGASRRECLHGQNCRLVQGIACPHKCCKAFSKRVATR
jgi:hypothetical protein